MIGTRLYSIEEVQKMLLSDTIQESFACYVANAPNGVRRIIKQWAGDETYEKIMAVAEQSKPVGGKDYEADMNPKNDQAKGRDFSLVDDNSEIVFEKSDNISNHNSAVMDEGRSYNELEFGARIDVDNLLLNLVNEDTCPLHKTKLDKIQVVVRFNQRSRFGIITNCCRECKRIYARKDEIKEIEEAITGKNIPYRLFED